MTDGHKHRYVRVNSPARKLLAHVLRIPIYHNRDSVMVSYSAYPYGICPNTDTGHPTCFVLTPLGFLHRWTGLTLVFEDD